MPTMPAGRTTSVRVLQRYPRALLALIGVSPRCSQYWVSPTSSSTGPVELLLAKTTLLRVAASVWGKPDEAGARWGTVDLGFDAGLAERASAVLTGLPLILDDTKRVKDPRMVATLLYEVTSGRGRGRGNRTTIEPTRTWRYRAAVDRRVAGNQLHPGRRHAHAVRGVRGMPFGDATPESRRVVERLTRRLQRFYGHAGPAFVEWVLQRRGDWKAWSWDYRQRVEAYAAQAPSAEAGRLAQYVAAVDDAARLVHAALELLASASPDPWSLSADTPPRPLRRAARSVPCAMRGRGRTRTRSSSTRVPRWTGSPN